MLKTAFVTVGF